MATKRTGARSAAKNVAASPTQTITQLFSNGSGRWATRKMAEARAQGMRLSSAVLRTADTLRHEDWKVIDKAVIEEAKIRLVGVADLITGGFSIPIANALGKLVYAYERVTDMGEAITSLDGLSQTDNDVQEFDFNQMPLPVTHKDFFVNLRKLEASRDSGESIDTLNVRTATRVVSERLEKMLFQGGPSFGGMPIYGYTTHPNRNTHGFDGGKSWDDSSKAGTSFLADVLEMVALARAQRQYGPFTIYVPGTADVNLDNDYNAGTSNPITIRQRLLQVSSVSAIRVADQMPAAQVVMKQNTVDCAAWLNGEQPQAVQWDEAGGFKVNFKVWSIGVPLIRADIQGRCGVVHLS
jgi:hypothetical protein